MGGVNKKTSDETAAGALTGVELLRLVQDGDSVQSTTGDVAGLVSTGERVPAGGATGQALVKTGSGDGATGWGDLVASSDVKNIVKITQADYDVLSPPVTTTLYMIDG